MLSSDALVQQGYRLGEELHCIGREVWARDLGMILVRIVHAGLRSGGNLRLMLKLNGEQGWVGLTQVGEAEDSIW